MKAELLQHERFDFDDGAIVEMVIWRVPKPVPAAVIRISTGYSMEDRANAWWVTTMNDQKTIIGTLAAVKNRTCSKRC